MRKIVEFLKGICIGVANVIPGFSGGTMAVILNIYDKFVDALANIISHPLKVIKETYALFIGIAVGVVLSVFTITKLLELFPIPTVLFFVGLIIGSIPNIYSSSKENGRTRWFDIIGFIVACTIIVILPILNHSNVEVGNVNVLTIVILFIVGVISSASMVIPGVSGSLVLMTFGYYLYVMTSISDFITKVLSLDFNGIIPLLLTLFSFGIGCIIGVVYISKLISYLFKKQAKFTYYVILGLLFASPFAIIYGVVQDYKEVLNLDNPWISIVGIISMVVGIILSGVLPKYINEKK